MEERKIFGKGRPKKDETRLEKMPEPPRPDTRVFDADGDFGDDLMQQTRYNGPQGGHPPRQQPRFAPPELPPMMQQPSQPLPQQQPKRLDPEIEEGLQEVSKFSGLFDNLTDTLLFAIFMELKQK